MFISPFTEIKKTQKYLESQFNGVNEHFIEDGSGKILHEQMNIKSLIWYPFAFDEHGYYVFTLNQILEQRQWTREEIGFLESVAKQVNLALIKIKFLEEKKHAELALQMAHDVLEQRVDERTAELRHSKRFTIEVLDSLTSHIAVLDASGVIVMVNETWRRFAQENGAPADRESYVGESYFNVCSNSSKTDDESANAALIGINAVLHGEKLFFRMEYPCHSPVEQRWFLMTVARLRDSQGVVISHTNITESKQVEEAMRRSQSMLARTESVAHIGSWRWEVATDTVRWSVELFRIVGLNPADGAPSFAEHSRIYHSEDMAELKRLVELTISEGTPYEIEIRAIRPDGETRICLATGFPERDENGKTTSLFGSLQDITEHKQAEKALLESKQTAESYLNIAAEIIVSLDYHGNITLLNESGYRLLGYCTEELTGKNWFDTCVPEESRVEVRGYFNRVIHGDETSIVSGENEVLTKNGDKKLIYWYNSIIRDDDGRFMGTLSSGEDFTVRKLMEKELQQAKIAADSASVAKSQFLANMSHELRNPMNGVLGMTQLLEMTELTEDQWEFVAALKLSGKNLLALINDILDLSKIEAGKIPIEPIEFCLQHCINDVAVMQKSAIFGKGLKLELEVSEDVPQLMMGDQLRVKQILHNLIGNAVKFTSQGGITISAQLLERQDSSLLVQIAVRDSGIGISHEALDKIFIPFEQEDGTTTRTYGGTGLGLAISRSLTELMGGSITVESTPGEGSCFTVTLPFTAVKESVAPQEVPQKAKVSFDTPPLRILLVENDQVNITFETLLLKKLGHEVAVAENGRECLSAMKQGTFDLVLMDINMPDMNGEEALREIRRNEQETDLHQKVIALTAYSLHGDKERFMQEGFDGYVSKPMDIGELIDEMKRVTGEG